MTNTEKTKAEKILDEAIRKHRNTIDDWKAYERCMKKVIMHQQKHIYGSFRMQYPIQKVFIIL